MLWADELLRLLHTREEEPEGQQPHQGSNTCHGDVPDLFTCFMAEVVRGQRRPILDGAQTADDIARVFASYSINVWRCMQDAKRLRAAISASRNEGVS